MWRSLVVLMVCLCLKAHFVLGAEEDTSENSNTNVAQLKLGDPVGDTSVSDESPNAKPLQVAMVTPVSEEASAVLGVRQSEPAGHSIALYPLIGTTVYTTPWWRNQVSNSYTAGLGIEAPVTHALSLAIEGTYGDYEMVYATPYTPNGFRHGYAVYTAGMSAKVYLFQSAFKPYIGGGMDALYFEGLTVGPPVAYQFNRWVGAGVAMAGMDVELSRSLSFGARATYTKPFINTPSYGEPITNTAEAGVLSADYFRFLGTVKVTF